MMKKLLIVCFTIIFMNVTYGQTNNNQSSPIVSIKQSGLATLSAIPVTFIVIDSTKIEIESFSDYDISSDWIESVSVKKDATSKKIYGSKNGVIFIYTKKEFKKEVLKEIEKKDASRE